MVEIEKKNDREEKWRLGLLDVQHESLERKEGDARRVHICINVNLIYFKTPIYPCKARCQGLFFTRPIPMWGAQLLLWRYLASMYKYQKLVKIKKSVLLSI